MNRLTPGSGRHEVAAACLLREVRLKQSERAMALAERWPGRIFRIDSDMDIGREAFEGWTRPVRLRLIENEGQYEMWVCDA